MDFHFIDAEWQENYPSAAELEGILSISEQLERHLRTVVTINARHTSAFEFAQSYCEVFSQHENASLCFVAGNPAYLSEEEKNVDSASRIRMLVATARAKLPSRPIFMGSEGMVDLATELSRRYSVVPFMLLDGALDDHVARIRSTVQAGEIATYCPCSLSRSDDEELIRLLGTYALRRRWVRNALRHHGARISEVRSALSMGRPLRRDITKILLDAIQQLAMCDSTSARDVIRKLSSMGVDYVAVLPVSQSPEEYEKLAELLRDFRNGS